MTHTEQTEDNFEVALEKSDEIFLPKVSGQRQIWGWY
jgi:hypothetical protein